MNETRFKEGLGTMLIARNARIYLGHSKSLALLLWPTYIRIRALLASGVLGGRSHYHVLIDIDG